VHSGSSSFATSANSASVQQALGGQEVDVVVNWVAFTADDG
jgi:hypothetical protein